MASITLDSYVIDSLMPDLIGHDRKPAALVVYLCLHRRASERPHASVRLSHQAIADATGLSRSAVQSALAHLNARQLIASSRSAPTAVPMHRVLKPWTRLGKRSV
jgi:CRP-like cAMP-binding protein